MLNHQYRISKLVGPGKKNDNEKIERDKMKCENIEKMIIYELFLSLGY